MIWLLVGLGAVIVLCVEMKLHLRKQRKRAERSWEESRALFLVDRDEE